MMNERTTEQAIDSDEVAWTILKTATFDLALLKSGAIKLEKSGLVRIFPDFECLLKASIATPQPQSATCKWTPMDDYNMPGTYEAECGAAWTFTEGGIKDNDTNYCPRCGSKIIDVAAISAQEPKDVS